MVGRAGIGLDNVDVEAATRRGVMVVNAPESNILSAAEHAMALLLAQARNIPQAHASLVAGKWERSKWEGVELHGKTLGVVGLGRIGALVAQRALAFGMRLCAYDPYVAADRARHMGVELLTLEELVAESDFMTIHLPKSADTAGLFNAELLAKAKPGLRIVNAARGGIVDEEALADAIRSRDGRRCRHRRLRHRAVHGLAPLRAARGGRDPPPGRVHGRGSGQGGRAPSPSRSFWRSPATSSPSPSTWPLRGCRRRSGPSCAWPKSSAGASPASTTGSPSASTSSTREAWPRPIRAILTLAALKGIFSAGTEEPVSYVNAPQLADGARPRVARVVHLHRP